MSDAQTLKRCDTIGCDRLVPLNISYCCWFCELAAEGGYEPYKHSTECDKRHRERGKVER